MHRLPWVLVVTAFALVSACVKSDAVDCGNGHVCPADRVCVQLTAPDQNLCVEQDQIDACTGIADGEECTFGGVPSACGGGACLAILCGNNRVEPGEVCDDGNTVTGDGTCSADCQSAELCGNGKVDPLVLVQGVQTPNEQCDDGNLLSGDGCSSTCQLESPRWAQLGRPIVPLDAPRMVYDSDHRRMVIFGGGLSATTYSDATYVWDGTTISQLSIDITPPARKAHGMAYDAARHRVVVFGGRSGDDKNAYRDTWTFDGTRWKNHLPSMSPPPRSSFGMVYDSAGKRVVLFGGFDGNGFRDDTWTWDGATWSRLTTTTSPGARANCLMTYDPKRAVIVMAGGTNDLLPTGQEALRDTWELSGSTWTRTTTTTPNTFDVDAASAYDTPGSRVLAFGGRQFGVGSAVSATTYVYTGTGWALVSPAASPPARSSAALASNPNDGQLLLFGGQDQAGTPLAGASRWTASNWATASSAPTGISRASFSGATDSQHGVSWVFGGTNASNQVTSTLGSFDGVTWRNHTWSGGTPPAREVAGIAYDDARGELVVFGGGDGTDPVAADTWRWNGTAWSSSLPVPSPSARYGPAMTYDARRKVIVLFGGFDNTTIKNDTWEWNGSTWTEIVPPVAPPGRAAGVMAYDEARGRVLLYGGLVLSSGLPSLANDLWAYDGTTWTSLSDPTPAQERLWSQLAYDRHAAASVVFGGATLGGAPLDDTWTWTGTQWSQQFLAARPPARGEHATLPAPGGAGILVVGGELDSGTLATDVWQFSYENAQSREICDIVTDNDGDGLAGCADPDCWPRCAPACPPGALCDVMAPHCGDGTCNAAVENCRICPQDCQCVAACGDSFCDAPETQATCPGDCTP